jgi:copper chaperone CopZ
MATGDSEETFRVSGMDCSVEVAAIRRAAKPLTRVLGVHANIVASTATIKEDGSVKAPDLAVTVTRLA